MNHEICLKEIFKRFNILSFCAKSDQCGAEGFWQLRKLVDVNFLVRGMAIARQLLKGQRHTVCFICSTGVFTAEFWLTCGARLPLGCLSETTASGWESFWGGFHSFPGFHCLILKMSPETLACEYRRKSFCRDKAPNMRFFVLLNS